jgi:hypothetical protein
LIAELRKRGCVKSQQSDAEASIADMGNLAVFGKTDEELRRSRGLAEGTPTCDAMSWRELAAIAFYEAMVTSRLEEVDARGDAQCEAAAFDVAYILGVTMISLSNIAPPRKSLPAPAPLKAGQPEVAAMEPAVELDRARPVRLWPSPPPRSRTR